MSVCAKVVVIFFVYTIYKKIKKFKQISLFHKIYKHKRIEKDHKQKGVNHEKEHSDC
jgi:hypothetical protein